MVHEILLKPYILNSRSFLLANVLMSLKALHLALQGLNWMSNV